MIKEWLISTIPVYLALLIIGYFAGDRNMQVVVSIAGNGIIGVALSGLLGWFTLMKNKRMSLGEYRKSYRHNYWRLQSNPYMQGINALVLLVLAAMFGLQIHAARSAGYWAFVLMFVLSMRFYSNAYWRADPS